MKPFPSADARGCLLSGAPPAARDAFEAALSAHLAWRDGADAALSRSLELGPEFVMAHVLQAYRLLGSRDPHSVRAARVPHGRAAALPMNERERAQLAAIGAVLDDDYDGARRCLGALLRREPRDVLALAVAHSLDYLTGDTPRLQQRCSDVLPAWSPALPGYHAVLAMHAFGLVENGDDVGAETAARSALLLEPRDARAHHALAHVHDHAGKPGAGAAWLERHVEQWGASPALGTHGWWHLALFHFDQGRLDRALALYDAQIRARASAEVGDLIDASSLLWRIELRGGAPGARWAELARAWAARIDDAYCSFSDMHAMLAFVGAREWGHSARLESVLLRAHAEPGRYGTTTRLLGLPACRALMAFGRGQHPRAIALLGALPAEVHRFGGSHAQRDVLHLTLQHAIERIRRPPRRRLAPHLTMLAPA